MPILEDWVWLCREGFERDLAWELAKARVLAPGLVVSPAPRERTPSPTFARQGFPITARETPSVESLRPRLIELAGDRVFALHVIAPDTEVGSRLVARGNALRAAILRGVAGAALHERPATELPGTAPLIQVCLTDPETAFVGACPISDAPSAWPGGKVLTKLPARAPSRSAMKLAEALAWLGFGPEAGDRCVDLGAAPGGWTWLLLSRGARVYAVDRARMHEEIATDPRLVHVRESAFTWEPPRRVDWLFCDMVWKPMEVAALLARWARKKLCRFVVANLKLPMKQRAETLARALDVVRKGGFREVRARHLYHDRDEVTVAAW